MGDFCGGEGAAMIGGHKDNRLIVGRRLWWPVFGPADSHLVCLGPPGYFKTSSLLVPNILYAKTASVIAASSKPDLMAATYEYRKTLGPVYCADFRPVEYELPEGVIPCRYNPIHACADWERAMQVAKSMTTTARTANSNESFFQGMAGSALASLMYASASAEPPRPFAEVLEWAKTRDLAFAKKILPTAPHGLEALQQLAVIENGSPVTTAGIWQSVSFATGAYAGRLLRDTAGNFDPACLVPGKDGSVSTLYIICPSDSPGQSAGAIVSALISENYEALKHATELNGGKAVGRTLYVADECARVAPLEKMPGILGQGRYLGLSVLLASQSFSDLKERWGTESQSLLDNARTRVITGGLADAEILSLLSTISGRRKQHDKTGKGHATYVPRYSQDSISHLRKGKVLVFDGRPARLLNVAYPKRIECLRRLGETPAQRLRREITILGLTVVIVAVVAMILLMHLHLR